MVERGGLENRCSLRATEGSNPSLSAKNASERAHFLSATEGPHRGMVFESLSPPEKTRPHRRVFCSTEGPKKGRVFETISLR